MGFAINRIDKLENDSIIEGINEDYHNGDCIILNPINTSEDINADLKYLVVDFNEYLILIYP